MIRKGMVPVISFSAGLGCALLAIFLLSNTEGTTKKEADLEQKVRSVSLERHFEFAGEAVPMNEDTRERLDRELNINAYLQATMILNLKRAKKHFPTVEAVLKKYDIPEDFKYLAIAESGLRNVTSSANAKGYWQFMKTAAQEMGLEITEEVDERLDIDKSTEAAAKYIRQLYKRFGNWTDVAAAYNMGPTAYARARAEQKESSYFDLHLNEETSRYIFRIMAMKEIMKDPQGFGYFLEDQHHYVPHPDMKDLTVAQSISSLVDFAHEHKVSYRLLKYYNPWLTGSKLTIMNGKTYIIKIPV